MRESLKSARRAAGLTQQAMADKLGISLRYYQQIEAGDRTGDFAIWDDLEDITGIHQRRNHDRKFQDYTFLLEGDWSLP